METPPVMKSGAFALSAQTSFSRSPSSYFQHTTAHTIRPSSRTRATPRFQSRRYKKEDIQQPWLLEKHPKEKFAWILPVIGMVLGLIAIGILCFFKLRAIPHHNYCPVLLEDFSSGSLDPKIWTKEVSVGGFGNGEFEQTTGTNENAYIQNGQLIIKPTLQDPALLTTNNVLNLGDACTGTSWTDCNAQTNLTNGSLINPIRSARLNTFNSARIKYGRVEVVAKMPKGDWLWPAIWMLPVNNTYGAWPASGEIDIAELRGNNRTYPDGGNEEVRSTLHWGPDHSNDGYLTTTKVQEASLSTFSDKFHTFGLEWSETALFTYLDNRLNQIYYWDFHQSFWQRGAFPASGWNGSPLVNPWAQTGRKNTPFDQDFALIINLAVGGTNGYFKDGVGGKPWVDMSPTAKKEFWDARSRWLPSWGKDLENTQMIVKSVKMWQQGGYNGCPGS